MSELRAPQRPPMRRVFTGLNRFDFDESKIPTGMAYKWLRVSLAGQEDTENKIMAELNGWTPVPAERHPELAGLSARKGSSIVRGGQMLVEQRKELTEEARQLDEFQAKHTLESQIQRLGLASKRIGGKGITRQNDVVGAEFVE